jgi:hypothetical protein
VVPAFEFIAVRWFDPSLMRLKNVSVAQLVEHRCPKGRLAAIVPLRFLTKEVVLWRVRM